MQTVSVIIPTLFLNKKLENYATRLSRYSRVYEVTTVVNTSGTDRNENIVHWRFLGKNKGFTGACNAGAKVAVGDLILFLNDDCDMSEEAFLTLVDFLGENIDVVATQPVVKKEVPSPKFQVPSTTKVNKNEILKRVQDDTRPESLNSYFPESLAIENIGFWVDTRIGKAQPVTVNSSSLQGHLDTRKGSLHPRNAGSRDDKNPENLNAYSPDNLIYGLSGTCLLIRKEVFERLGMWDESFHSYLEDVDLAIRLHKAGYKVAPCLDAEVFHEHMATSSKMGLYKEIQDVRNWWRLILKHPDVFVGPNTIFPLLLERVRNINGLVKKFLHS